MAKIFTAFDIGQLYQKLTEFPSFIGELTEYQKDEVRKYAQGLYNRFALEAVELVKINDKESYPVEFQGGGEYDYWIQNEPGAQEAKRIVQLLDQYKNTAYVEITSTKHSPLMQGVTSNANKTAKNVVETLRSLVCPNVTYRVLEEFADAHGMSELNIFAPDYRVALKLFDEHFPDRVDEDKWVKIRGGYRIANENFDKEFQYNLDQLVADKDSRVVYFKRLFRQLYTGPNSHNKLNNFAKYFQSEQFKSLKGKIDDSVWQELDTIGYAALLNTAYSRSIDFMLEREFETEGMPIKNGWRSEKEEGQNNNTSVVPSAQTDKYQNFLEEIATIEHINGLTRNRGLVNGLNQYLYSPMATLSQRLENKVYNEMRDFCRKEVKKLIDNLSDVVFWVKAYEDSVKKQPDKQYEILIEHRDRYVDIITERYIIVENWYTDFWDEEKQTVEKINDLESTINLFCDGYNKPFLVGLKLLKNLFIYRRAIDWFNNLIESSKKGKVSSNSEMSKPVMTLEETRTFSSFIDAFIDESSASVLLEGLKKIYQDSKADQYAYMLYALYDLGFIADPATVNKSTLHNRLSATFGNVGSRQNLNAHINRLNAPSQEESIEIQNHKKKIKALYH